MICFQDRTFCIAKCGNLDCQSRLTAQVEENARKWWGSDGAPIAVADLSDGCKSFKPEVSK